MSYQWELWWTTGGGETQTLGEQKKSHIIGNSLSQGNRILNYIPTKRILNYIDLDILFIKKKKRFYSLESLAVDFLM